MAPELIHWIVLQLPLYRGNLISNCMQNNPNIIARAAAAPAALYTVNLYKGHIFVYSSAPSGFTRGVTIGKKVLKLPQDRQHLDLVKLLYPGAIIHGRAQAVA